MTEFHIRTLPAIALLLATFAFVLVGLGSKAPLERVGYGSMSVAVMAFVIPAWITGADSTWLYVATGFFVLGILLVAAGRVLLRRESR